MTGFKLKLRRRGIPDAEIVTDIVETAKRLQTRTITRTAYDAHGSFGATTVLRRFKTWNAALEAAGLDLSNRLNIPEEELFENLADVWQALGRQPVGTDIAKAGASNFSLGTYEKRFGSWNKALLAFIEYVNGAAPNPGPARSQRPRTDGKRSPRKINWRLRASILIRDNCICKMCGASPAKSPSVTLHVDHIIAWANGGETAPDNLQTLCETCNIGKSDAL
jgi:hypothetical protein